MLYMWHHERLYIFVFARALAQDIVCIYRKDIFWCELVFLETEAY